MAIFTGFKDSRSSMHAYAIFIMVISSYCSTLPQYQLLVHVWFTLLFTYHTKELLDSSLHTLGFMVPQLMVIGVNSLSVTLFSQRIESSKGYVVVVYHP